jgi:hypothetical protein
MKRHGPGQYKHFFKVFDRYVTKDIYRVYIDAGMDEVSKIWTGVRQVLDRC